MPREYLTFLNLLLGVKRIANTFSKTEKKTGPNTELNLSDFYFYFSLYIGRYMNFEKAIEIETSVTKSIRTDDYLKLFGINYNMLFRGLIKHKIHIKQNRMCLFIHVLDE